MRLLARAVTVLATSVLVIGTLAVPAQAASPVRTSSSPAAGSTIKTKPTGVSVTFDQAVAITSTISVAAPSGTSPCTKDTQSAPATTIKCTFTGVPLATVNDGTYTVSYVGRSTGTDPDGTGSFQFVLDTVAPVAPTALAIAPSPYLAASDSLTVTGPLRAGLGHRQGHPDQRRESEQVPSRPAADKTFAATFTQAEMATLANGTVTASVTSTDVAGNVSPAATTTVEKDTARPTITASDPVDGGSKKPAVVRLHGHGQRDSRLDQPRRPLRRHQHPDRRHHRGGRPTPSRPRPATLPDGAYRAKIYLVDAKGNAGNAARHPEVRTFTIDGTAPAAPAISTPLPKRINLANETAYPVSGTGEAGASLSVKVGSVTKTVTVACRRRLEHHRRRLVARRR